MTTELPVTVMSGPVPDQDSWGEMTPSGLMPQHRDQILVPAAILEGDPGVVLFVEGEQSRV
ncbi:MAG: hypothetical protein ACREYF_19220 [Gammaproteobacteria bacterium]